MATGPLKKRRLILSLLAFASLVFFVSISQPTDAASGINQQINFQGRLLNSQGATVPDGYYNIEFKIYQDGDGQSVGNTTGSPSGSLKWTEDHLNTSSQGVQVKNGYFSVQLGSITAFGSNIDWNQDTLWLSLNIGNTNSSCTPFSSCSPDGEMTPMKRLTSTPYALNSGLLGGLSSAQYIQLAQGLQTDASNSTNSIAINKTGTGGNFLNLQASGADAFTLTNTGDISFGANANHTISVATAGAGVAGKSLTISAGGAGSGGSALAGGNLVLQGGAGGGTNGNGGNITIDAGAKNGTGTDGTISIGTSTASAITIGKSSNTTTIGGNLAVSSVPIASDTSSLIQIGNPIAYGNNATNGGTYLGMNIPSSGAGSAADLVNFQVNDTSVFKLDKNGVLTLSSGSSSGILLGAGTNANLYGNADTVQTDGRIHAAGEISASDLAEFNLSGGNNLTVIGIKDSSYANYAGIAFGSSQDTNIYRDSAGVLKTDGAFTAAGTITGTTLNGTTGINTGAGAGTQRIDSSGNLLAIGNITTAGASTLSTGSNALTVTASNFNLSSAGVITLAGGQTTDVTTASGTSATAITINPGSASTANGAGLTLQSGATSKGGSGISRAGTLTIKGGTNTGTATGAGEAHGGNVVIQGGDSTVNNDSYGGDVTIDGGVSNGSGISGAVNIGATTARQVTIGNSTAGHGVTLYAGSGTSIGLYASDITSNQTSVNFLQNNVTTLNIGGAVDSGGINLAGGSGSSGCTLNGSTGDFACSGTINGQTLSSSASFTGTLTLQGASLTVGSGTTAGSLKLNTASTRMVVLQGLDPTGSGNATIQLPSIAGGSTDTICLQTANNCNMVSTATTSGAQNYVTKYNNAGGTQLVKSLLYDNGSGVSVGGSSPSALFNVGASNQFQVSSAGAVTAVGLNSGTGLIQGTGGLTVSGTYTLSSLNTAGVLHTNASGVVSTGTVALGTETSGNYVATLGTLTGLSTTGNSGAGSTPTLSVTYGATSTSAVRGDTTLNCPSGSGNLTGGGTAITLGSGGTCGSISIVNNPSFTGTVTASNSSGVGLAVSGTPTASATQSLFQLGSAIASGNSATNGGTYFGLNAPNTGAGSAADFVNLQYNNASKFLISNAGAVTQASSLTVQSGGVTVQGGGVSVTGNSTIAGTLGSLTGLTSSGTITFSGLNSAGVVHTNSSGVLSTSLVILNTETSGSYVQALGTLTGLSTTGNSGAATTPTLSVNYGATSTSAVRGDTTLNCPSAGTNLSGGGTAITLGNGGTCGSLSLTSSPTISGLLTANGGLTLGASTVLTNGGATLNTAKAISDLPTGGSIGTAATTVDIYTAFTITQTTAGQTLTIPSPTTATAGRVIYVSNTGSTSFTLLSSPLSAGSTATLMWNGSAWSYAGADGSSVLNQNSSDQTANFRISGTGRANTSFTSPLFDSITGGLSLGTSTATSLTIGGTTNTASVTLQGATTANYIIGTTTGTGTITIGQSTASNTVSIGASIGASGVQIVNIGTSATSSSTTNVSIGSTIGGTTTINGAGGISFTANTSLSSGKLLTLGNSSTLAGSCTNGSIYYDSSANRFRGCESSTWITLDNYADLQTYTSGDNTWTKPPNVTVVQVIMVGGGGGGGGGGARNGGAERNGGGGGGGGSYVSQVFAASDLASNAHANVGSSGSAGNGAASSASNGSSGGAGGASCFSSSSSCSGTIYGQAYGGGGGAGGGGASPGLGGGGGGGGTAAVGASSTTASGGGGGNPLGANGGGSLTSTGSNAAGGSGAGGGYGQGGTTNAGGAGGGAEYGGGGGGGAGGGNSASGNGGSSLHGAGGGGAGASTNSGNSTGTGGTGGNSQAYTSGGGGAAGTSGSACASGGNASNGTDGTSIKAGTGGGGGGANGGGGAAGCAGGNGGAAGGGGGGGGSGSTTGGAGGSGGAGKVWVISW